MQMTENNAGQHSVGGNAEWLYLKGRYLKMKRGISQTPFILRGGKVMAEASVESVIMDRVKHFVTGERMKFIPAGREDMDVRMLGEGRPFAIEIKNPEQLEELKAAVKESASLGVIAHDLQLAKRDVILAMKMGEEETRKMYRALVWISRSVSINDLDLLNHLKELAVIQSTPLRVAHRRANTQREKVVHWMKAEKVDSHEQYFVLDLCTSAGCYIKEFIHGDYGRTSPSLYDLLQVDYAQCCALDVTKVEIDLERHTPEFAVEDDSNKKCKQTVDMNEPA